MKKLFLFITAFICITMLNAQTKQQMKQDNYAQLWLKVSAFEQKSLPKLAAEEVNNILRRAIADKNSPQVIKALIHQGKYDLAIDAQNDTVIFHNLNQMLAQSADAVEKSVLHSMLGELYLQYYRKDQWQINQRTALGDFVPSDMKEWTRNIFYDKAVAHLNTSIASQRELLGTNVEKYAPVVELGNDSRRFFPTMYDFLARRAIEILSQLNDDEDLSRTLAKKNISPESLFLPADEFAKLAINPQPNEYGLWALETYRKYIFSLLERKMDKSAVLTELDKLDYLSRLNNAYNTYALPSLENMLKKWDNQDFSVEIVEKMAELYLRKINELQEKETAKKEEKTKEYYEFLQKYIRLYPHYERIGLLQNRREQLIQPSFTVNGENTYLLGSEKTLRISYKNLDKLVLKLYRFDTPLLNDSYYNTSKEKEKKTFVKKISVALPFQVPYLSAETTVQLNVNEYGAYKIEFESDKKEYKNSYNSSDYYFSVSDLAAFARSTGKDTYEFFVINRLSGEAVKNAKIQLFKVTGDWQNRTLQTLKVIPVNETGLVSFTKGAETQDLRYQPIAGNDNGGQLTGLPYSHYRYSGNADDEDIEDKIAIFTDRNIYRPGQTVYFKVVVNKPEKENQKIVENREVTVTLFDVNSEEIAERILHTNEFGSVAGEFVLPQGILPGDFNIEAETDDGDRYAEIRVEEYKRPTFDVTFDKIEKTYKFGEEVTLKGKAENYSGIKLQGATVNYRITRSRFWWWYGSSGEQFDNGTVKTDENGNFEISFIPQKGDSDASQARNWQNIYSFSVEASVTDVNGETQTGSYQITVGDVSMMLDIEIPAQWEKSSETLLKITAKNLDGNDVSAKGTYQIFSLHENDSINKQVAQDNFTTGEQPVLKEQLKKLPSGKYKIKLQSKDDRGNNIETEKNVLLFSYSDEHPPIKTNEWLVKKNTTFAKNKKAEVILGVSDKNVHVLYELWQSENLLERKWITLSNENKLFSFPYKAEYKDGVSLFLTYVKDEKFYTHKVDFTPEKEKKELQVKLDVFRDKLRPGAQEEWRIAITDAVGKSALAEVLASMYDFSLEKIYQSQQWGFDFPTRMYYTAPAISKNQSFEKTTASETFVWEQKDVDLFYFDRFNWYNNFSSLGYGNMVLRSASPQVYGSRAAVEGVVQGIVSEDSNELAEVMVVSREIQKKTMMTGSVSAVNSTSSSQYVQEDAPKIRKNFSETAFFFPQLRTNAKGETQIAFTVPESNTKWRFRVLAHDKSLNVGQAEAFAVSQKELMVTPNMPRFFRAGDRASISTKISNLSDGAIDGTVRIEFFNPVTDETVTDISVENASQPFSLAKDASANAAWTFDVPANIDLIGVRIIAQNQQFSDGEQHALAVLPNRMLVTETLRMDVNGNQTTSFTMDRLAKNASPTAQNYRLTLEFASNPAWYAVQALPVLANPDGENAVSWFASYYANTLGAHIGKAYPKVSAMIEAWKKQGGTGETLLSNLEKNQELKNVLLEETPWVLEAKNESEQKQKLSLLFDLNRSQNLTAAAIEKLKELQTAQGGWSWFKGFYPSRSITQYILYGFNQLKELKAAQFSADVIAMQEKAIGYVDSEALRNFENLKKWNKNWRNIKTVSTSDLEYIYVRASYPQYALNKQAQEMVSFYTSVVEKNWTQFGLYERSLIAVLMQKNGKQNIVQDMLKSYREHATVNDETGMFWANNRAHVFMSQSATSVHTFIMDAFRLGGASATETDNMKRWLLKQKQTQLWESTHATADAIYALLSAGSDWFGSESKTAITLGGKTVEPEKTELGTGYFKESWSRTEIRPEMGNVKVVHNGNAPAWGALYLQYFENLDKITKTDASLDVEKLLFVEKTDASGTKLVRIAENNPLKVGDKVVVRLTVRTDRDLEFVHLKDMRAACFEPVEQLSQTKWQGGTVYYQTSKDASTNFYFDALPRGTYVFEYAVFVNRTGSYSNGITTVQCMYAPEFTSHTGGIRVEVNE